MAARIYKPARTAMQSGNANTKEWVLDYTPEEPREIADAMLGVPGVQQVHDLHVWTVGSGFPSVSAHVLVDPGADRARHTGRSRRVGRAARLGRGRRQGRAGARHRDGAATARGREEMKAAKLIGRAKLLPTGRRDIALDG